MNFFGHAVVAAEFAETPEVVFGAMLPDLLGMVGSAGGRLADVRVERGVALHHATDAVFHHGPYFMAHQAQARALLSNLPIRRGPRRAVAHVGVELILDAALNGPGRLQRYRDALSAGQEASFSGLSLPDRMKLRSLVGMLARRTRMVTPGSPAGVVERLHQALWPRPILRLETSELAHVATWAAAAWQPIHDEAETWLASLTEPLTRSFARADGRNATCSK